MKQLTKEYSVQISVFLVCRLIFMYFRVSINARPSGRAQRNRRFFHQLNSS